MGDRCLRGGVLRLRGSLRLRPRVVRAGSAAALLFSGFFLFERSARSSSDRMQSRCPASGQSILEILRRFPLDEFRCARTLQSAFEAFSSSTNRSASKERVMVAIAYSIPKVIPWRACEVDEPWMALHHQLLSIARRRAALDAEELGAIREAIRVQLWRKFGMTSLREYLEHFMGYGPHVAAERIRVTEALEALPAIEDALATGQLSYSAVREVTRIATPKTEEVWLDACVGKNLRQIEDLVAEREVGDVPTDAPKPDVRPRRVSMSLRPAARAALRAARQAIEVARGERIDDSELIEEVCRAYMAGGSGDAPRAQIAITTCKSCSQAWQHAAGRAIAITKAEYETAACDAVHIGSLDGAPSRAKSDIPPATKRAVKQRDGYCCTIPGCRSAAFLDVHHIVPRVEGGTHHPSNLTTLCGGHHGAHHRGEIGIAGKAPQIVVTRKFEVPQVSTPHAESLPHVGEVPLPHVGEGPLPHVGEVRKLPHVGEVAKQPRVGEVPKLPHVAESILMDAVLALTGLGARPQEAQRAVAVARGRVGPEAAREELVRAALQECRW
ncbi:MAG: HNH endonuclease [Deltaproteobacteria bacterium]|nr:HNH endonuclease [Deltaproteobacteria bacterium]